MLDEFEFRMSIYFQKLFSSLLFNFLEFSQFQLCKFQLNHKSSGKTPLQVAAHQGHIDIVVILKAAGVNLEVSDDDGDTALHYSAFG